MIHFDHKRQVRIMEGDSNRSNGKAHLSQICPKTGLPESKSPRLLW